MVQLEEVKDAELNAPQPGPASDEFEDDADFTDTDSSLSSAPPSPGLPPQESLSDRIYALKDMLPPSARRRISSSVSSLTSLTKTTALFTGKGLYVLSTSALLVMVPWAVAYVEEQAIVEQEREMKQREVMGEGVSPGAALGKPAL
ncbi:hypothetical protein G7Y79_00025g057980 [Physcia stellaris]|nr:hypothetical protein G7Y79_00025g057980 [Physcia stellaris]